MHRSAGAGGRGGRRWGGRGTTRAGSEVDHDDLTSMRNCIRLEGLTFRAELAEGGAERLELMRT
jgi:hypothetical protein